MNNRHVSIDKDYDNGYVIRLWNNGELMHIFYAKNVSYYTLTITSWLDGESFK